MPAGTRNDGRPHKPNGNAPDRLPFSKKPRDERKSTRGAINPVADQSAWRRRLQPDLVKFDDERKGRFLDELLKHGKRVLAAEAVDISMQTVRDHLKIDPEFEELFNQVLARRAEMVTRQIEEEALEGFEEPIFNTKTGELLGTKRVYETPLRLAILRRYDPEYKDRSEVHHSGTVGVLVAPAALSPQEWMAQEQDRNLKRVQPDKDNLDAPPQIIDAQAERRDKA
jgi:hypothetical protein